MNFIVRGLFAFKNTPAQYARKIADAIYEYQRGEISRAQLAKVVAIYGLFNSWMYSALTTLGVLAWYYDDDDADEILADELFLARLCKWPAVYPCWIWPWERPPKWPKQRCLTIQCVWNARNCR